jgi:hypothetical protein
VLYGDNNRDGQTQNPGNGIGVRAYLVQAQGVLASMNQGSLPTEVREPVLGLTAALTRSQTLAQEATQQAYKVFAVDTTGEAETIAGALQPVLVELQGTITNTLSTGAQLLTPGGERAGAADQALLPLRELLSEDTERGLLAGAGQQTELALTHLGFLQDALGQNDLTTARRHAEHVVNILEGEGGVLYGDNDRDGQPQNPGNGIGVRAYLAQAQPQAQAILETLDKGAANAEVRQRMVQLIALISRGQTLTEDGTAKGFQVFAADTPREIESITAELDLLLRELQAAIAGAFTTGAQLLPP